MAVREVESLESIRYRLEVLVRSRLNKGLTEAEEADYEQLAEREAELLATRRDAAVG